MPSTAETQVLLTVVGSGSSGEAADSVDAIADGTYVTDRVGVAEPVAGRVLFRSVSSEPGSRGVVELFSITSLGVVKFSSMPI